jgi:hypothetical protein
MSDLFDDHPNVVVLEQVVRKLVLQQCRLSADPDAVLADWRAFLQQHHDLYVRSGFSEEVTPAAGLNGLLIAGQFEQFSEELTTDFKDGI